MEIYLLREEKEVGPYTTDDIRAWLTEGHVSASEYAWSPGLENWVPLNDLLAQEQPAPAEALPPAPPALKATARQKAFLSYMGISFAAEITDEEAKKLTDDASRDPKLAARVMRWQDDRLEFYPEIFAAELEERRANRPAYFYRMVQTEGGDCFSGVTKAHCQVLVGYLDVSYPRWDAKLKDATWHYFFPAIAEKFPQLVRKEWRPKLKYKDGPKVAAELLDPIAEERERARQAGKGRSYGKPVVAGVVLALLSTAVYGAMHPEKIPSGMKTQWSSLQLRGMALIRGDDGSPTKPVIPKRFVENEPGQAPPTKSSGPVPADGGKPVSAETKVAVEDKPADPSMATGTEAKPLEPAMSKPTEAMTKPSETPMGEKPSEPATEPKPAMETKPAEMAMNKPAETPMAESPMAEKPEVPAKPTEALFNPNANNATATMTPPAAPAAPATAANEVRLTHAVQMPSKYGTVTINAGTMVKIVARQGDWVTLNHLGQAVRVPVTSTDLP